MAKEVTWDTLDWDALGRLRGIFLSEETTRASYWTSYSDLANYDFTFGRRVAWKWDALLRELRWRKWTPPSNTVLDWGCGSGVAGRRVIEFFGRRHFETLLLYDRSELAVAYAQEAAQKAFPKLRIQSEGEPLAPQGAPGAPLRRADAGLLSGETPLGLLVVSHVLTELDERERAQLLRVARRAQAILCVEPGAFRSSRELIADFREPLRAEFNIVAPCTHQAVCGLLTPENARHWCHNFADPPPGIMADSNWVRFGKRAGIDLRRLPYSFLVMERPAAAPQGGPVLSVAGCSRIIGEPRHYKGHALITSCQENGVRDLTLRKRDAPPLFKALKDCGEAVIHQWTLSDDRIIRARQPRDQGAESR